MKTELEVGGLPVLRVVVSLPVKVRQVEHDGRTLVLFGLVLRHPAHSLDSQSVSVSQRIKTDQRPAMAVYLLLNVCIFFKEILIFPREPYILPYI